jgi:hypothetical protein
MLNVVTNASISSKRQGAKIEDSSLLRGNDVLLSKQFSTFRKDTVHSSSGLTGAKGEPKLHRYT